MIRRKWKCWILSDKHAISIRWSIMKFAPSSPTVYLLFVNCFISNWNAHCESKNVGSSAYARLQIWSATNETTKRHTLMRGLFLHHHLRYSFGRCAVSGKLVKMFKHLMTATFHTSACSQSGLTYGHQHVTWGINCEADDVITRGCM